MAERNGTIRVKDERILIPLVIETADGDVPFNLFFNPADPNIWLAMDSLENLDTPDFKQGDDKAGYVNAIREFTTVLNSAFDEIFGDGKAREVFRYSGVKLTIIHELMKRVKKDIEAFNKEMEREQAAARKAQIEAAKTESLARHPANK